MKLFALLALIAVPAVLASTDAKGPEAAAPLSSAPAAYKVDGGHSSVVFRVKHADASNFYGTFNQVSGSFTVDEANPAGSSIEISIQADSVDSNSEQRDGHIKSPDFLSAKEFPTISFKSTEVSGAGGELKVTGDLTFRGVTKSVTADVQHVGSGEMRGNSIAGYEAVLDIKRTDFGSTYGVDKNMLSDNVHLIISLEGVKG
jgi:polyisoprenoid-binding protein YceI